MTTEKTKMQEKQWLGQRKGITFATARFKG
jgi:hypothetical protein